MTRYYFHLWTGRTHEIDETGVELETADAACLEAILGAREISFDLLRGRQSASGYRFDVCDDQGRLVHAVSFAEALNQRIVRRPAQLTCVELVNRGYALAGELKNEIALAQRNLQASRDLVAMGAAHPKS